MKEYHVEILEIGKDVVEERIGPYFRKERAEEMKTLMLTRIDRDNYFVRVVT
mgnify:CR=1 FL=1